jgi:probable O-glycosylation ligase (exosortase A-associated)
MKGLIFTYILTYCGGFAALFNPYIGLLVYVCFAILKPDALWHWQAGGMPPYSSRVVALALLAGWIARGTGNWNLGKAWKVVFALMGILLWSVITTLQSYHQEPAWVWVEDLCKIVLPFLVGITTMDSARKLWGLAWVIILSHGYVALELNLSYLIDHVNTVAEYGFGGMDNNSVGIAMNTGFGLAVFMALSKSRWWQQGLAVVAALSMAHVVMLTFSRGGMMGLIVTGAITFLLLKKSGWHYVFFFLGALVLLRLAGPQVQERFLSSFASGEQRDVSAEGRIKLWSDCLDILRNNPVFGVGPRHFPILAPQYGWPAGKEAHSTWLQAGAEMGVPGLALLALFYGVTAWPLWRMIRRKDQALDPQLDSLARMVIASLAGFAVSAQFVSLIGLEVPYYVALLGAGTLKLADAKPSWEQEESGEAAPAASRPDLLDWPAGSRPMNAGAAP